MRIVLCGSQTFIPNFFELKDILSKKGNEIIIPREFIDDISKKEASLLHFKEIENKITDALLIVNETKNGIDNYIGANTFAELALGFYKGKKIYLLNDIYEPFREELSAWEVVCLKGNLEGLE